MLDKFYYLQTTKSTNFCIILLVSRKSKPKLDKGYEILNSERIRAQMIGDGWTHKKCKNNNTSIEKINKNLTEIMLDEFRLKEKRERKKASRVLTRQCLVKSL